MAFAGLWRFPALMWPLRPDEAGFTMVARAWDPRPDSLYGPYFVDRTPLSIGLVKLSDLVGGPYFIRVIGLVCCAVAVLLLASIARRISGPRGAVWTAWLAAALLTTTLFDPVATKGEVLGITVVVASFWCALTALEHTGSAAVWRAGAAGLLATTAIGIKQNLAAGLLFGGVVLLGSMLTGRISRPAFLRLAAAAAVGALVPVLAVVGWCLASGVHLSELWFVSFGFRGEANDVINSQSQTGPDGRAEDLRLCALTSGLALVVGWFLLNLRGAWRRDRVLTVVTVAVLAFDLFGVYAGGSYWRAYLLNLVPGTALAVACVIGLTSWRDTLMRAIVVVSVVSAVWSNIVWASWALSGESVPTHTLVGEAIAEAAEPGDTMVVYGGRADIQLAAGMPSPYQQLWSLPMRTIDKDLAELRRVMSGPEAPVWFVEGVGLGSWDLAGHEDLERIVLERYRPVEVCGIVVHVRRDAPRELPPVDCEASWVRTHGLGDFFDRQPIRD